MALELDRMSWFGQRVFSGSGSLQALRGAIPLFVREPFGGNEYLDAIYRKPFLNDHQFIPVASVSKSYVLIQHHDIIDALEKAIKETGFDPVTLKAEINLSEYGEKMHIAVRMPNFDFNPGDGHPITMMINCLNSVDKSCALEINMSWKRLICSNGMMNLERSYFRKIHNTTYWMSSQNISEYLKEQFESAPGELSVYKKWKDTALTIEKIEGWADETVSAEWGAHAAARTCHIARTGFDGQIEDPFEKALPHNKKVKSELRVPGACAPVDNAFHLSQVLSWIASHRNSLEDQMEKIREIHGLMKSILN
jgi:hypothetical protein